MSDPLYRKALLRLAADAHGAGALPDPHRSGTAHNPACGDRVTFDIVTDAAGRITALAHDTRACVLAQASASILGRAAERLSRAEVEALRAQVSAMLKEHAPGPPAPFDAYAAFDGVMTYPGRQTCVLLPLDALLAAFNG